MLKRMSLKMKAIILVSVITLGISAITTVLSSFIIVDNINDMYKKRVNEIARTVATHLDKDDLTVLTARVKEGFDSQIGVATSGDWESDEAAEYLGSFEDVYDMPEFMSIMDDLKSFQSTFTVDCIYLANMDPYGYGYVYLIDAAEEDALPVGFVDPWYLEGTGEERALYCLDPTPNISNSVEYGHLITGAAPIFDDSGNIIAHVSVDISMDEVFARQRNYISVLIMVLLAFTLIAVILSAVFVDRFVVRPVSILSEAAGKFIDEGSNEIHNSFADIDIKSGDEIEFLSNAMKQMELNLNQHIDSLVATRQKLSNTIKEANKLEVLANRDALTGVRNKLAYESYAESINKRIALGNVAFSVTMIDLNNLKYINDNFGHEKGDIAIRNVCKLICAIFAHSAVFRIGGDEFAVISENQDFMAIEELIAAFNERVDMYAKDETLSMWERNSAAIGHAVYDPSIDHEFIDTFKRADSLMYHNKEIMKKNIKL